MGNPQSSPAQSSKRSSTLSPPVKKALTLKEQRALYAAKAKAAGKGHAEPAFRTVQVPITSVTSKPVSRRATKPTSKSPKTARARYGSKVVMKENLRPSSKFAAKTSTEPSPESGSTISPPVIKKALTLKEQRALYAARGKVTAPVLREVQSNVAAESPTELSVRRYYSTSSTSTRASSSASPKTDTDEASVGSRTSASGFSRTATRDSAGSSSRGSSRASAVPICPQSAVRKALAKFEREEAEAALRRNSRKKTTSTPVPKTSGQYTLKEQMKFAAAKRAASEKADVEDPAKTSVTEGSSTSGKKRSRDEASSDNRKDDGSGRQTDMEPSSRGNKRAKWQ